MKKFWLVLALVLVSLTAYAANLSTINPSVPAQNAPLTSAPVRNNFQAAYGDINNLYSYFPLNLNGNLIAGVLGVPNGGTGLSSIGLPNQFLCVNPSGTAYTYCSGTSGSISSVSGTPGQITASTISGAVTIGLPSTITSNELFSGTINHTGPFQISGTSITFPGSGLLVGTTDTQTLTNKSISASEINSGSLAIANGGTAAATATGALSNLTGNPSSGNYVISCTTGSSCGVSAAGGGTGTVTSVGVSGANGIGVSGSPVTTSGTIALSLGSISPSSVTTGAIAGTTANLSGNLTTNITGSTQCVHANSSGVLSGTGSDCGAGGGSVSVTAGTPDIVITPSPGTNTFTVGSNLTAANGSTGVLPVANGGTACTTSDCYYGLPNFRSNLVNVRNETGFARVCLLGDSTTAGNHANNNWSPSNALAYALTNNYGISSSYYYFFGGGIGLGPPVSQGVTVGSSWSIDGAQGLSAGGYPYSATTSTNALSFNPQDAFNVAVSVDTFNLFYIIQPGNGVLSYQVDSGSVVTINTNSTAAVGKTTITTTLGTHTLNLKWSSGGKVDVIGVEAYNSTFPAVIVDSLAAGAATAFDVTNNGFATTTFPWNLGNPNFYSSVGCNVIMTDLGINDEDHGTSKANYLAAMTTLLSAQKTTGADLILETHVPSNPSGGGSPVSTQNSFMSGARILAASDGALISDTYVRWVSFALASPLNYYADNFVHPSQQGNQERMTALAQILVGSPDNAYGEFFFNGLFTVNPNTGFVGFNLANVWPTVPFQFGGAGQFSVPTTDTTDQSLVLTNANTTAYTMMKLTSTGSYSYGVGIGNGAETARSVANKWFVYDFNANAMRMVIANDGKVGIGSSTPVSSLDLSQKTDAINLPSGTSAQRPSPVNGMLRYNSTVPQVEAYYSGAWNALLSGLVNLASQVTGTLPTANGGLGANESAATGVVQMASGTTSVTTALASGTTATTQSSADSTTKVATTAFVNPGSTISGTGYRKNPDGWIEEWISSVSPSSNWQTGMTWTFPLAFPTAFVGATCTPLSAPQSGDAPIYISASSASSVTMNTVNILDTFAATCRAWGY